MNGIIARWKLEKARHERVYGDMRQQFPPRCWHCMAERRPEWYAGPWMPNERSHIVNNPRLLDRRCAVLLCSVCHGQSHGTRYAAPDVALPAKLSRWDMIGLKYLFDPEYFDLEFLEACCVGRLV